MACGKTSVSAALQELYDFIAISSGAFLRAQLAAREKSIDRHHLQELGDALDISTGFSWLIDSVARPAIDSQPATQNWLMDAVRKPCQVELFRVHFGAAVRHVHLVAPESVLQQRYANRGGDQLAQYHASVMHPNEQSARSLESLADEIMDTEALSPFEIADRILNVWER
ncbi:hypothetical protein BV326_01255 [Pseudomonas syringae pv. actinidiae]|nr:hypothetical protein BV326_01255 [Pseudomonas syringae pv. actinidiae]